MTIADTASTADPAPFAQHEPSRRTRHAQPDFAGRRRGFGLLLALLVAALLLGGAIEPLSELLIGTIAILALLVAAVDGGRDLSRPGWLAVAAVAAIAAWELVPIPYGLWRSLPGHAPFAATLDALGLGGGWRPLSLDPNATRASLLATLPGLAAFILTLRTARRDHDLLARIIVAGALATALLGCLQIVGGERFYLYSDSNFGNLTGLFANYNHAADQLLIGIALTAWLGMPTRDRARFSPMAGGLMVLFAVATLLTTSRTGAALLAGECLLVPMAVARGSKSRMTRWVALCIPVFLAVGALYLYNPSVGRALDRFHDVTADLRPEIWRATIRAVPDFFPTGSGLGTFVPIYARYELLDTMPLQIINHAHDEYLELLLELGLVGLVVLLVYAVALGRAAARAWRRGEDRLPAAAAIAIGVLLASSTVEFPLRNASAMVVFGVLNGFVFAATQRHSRRRSEKMSQRRSVPD